VWVQKLSGVILEIFTRVMNQDHLSLEIPFLMGIPSSIRTVLSAFYAEFGSQSNMAMLLSVAGFLKLLTVISWIGEFVHLLKDPSGCEKFTL
jgi:hypothetical protein